MTIRRDSQIETSNSSRKSVVTTRLRNTRPMLTSIDTRIAQPAPKVPDRELVTSAHRAWRAAVMSRAGHRCEWVERGVRCERAMPEYRLIADHVVERKDGGALFDVANGMATCWMHHARKTVAVRAERMARRT
jgi:hypothetical protein